MPTLSRTLVLILFGVGSLSLGAEDFWPEHPAGQPPSRAASVEPAAARLPPLAAPAARWRTKDVAPAAYESPAEGPSASDSKPREMPQESDLALAPDSPTSKPIDPGEDTAEIPTGRAPSIPFGPSREEKDAGDRRGPRTGVGSVLTVVGSLAVVLGLFAVFVWALRRTAPRGSLLLPTEVVETLGRAPLAGRQQVLLIRVGKRLLLLSVTPDGAETLTEIDDPDEVTRLAGLCRQSHPDSASATFRQVFSQLSAPGALSGLRGRRQKQPAYEASDLESWKGGHHA